MSNQRDARRLARVAGLGVCVAETGIAKNPCIGLERKAYKRRVIAFKQYCNICREQLGLSLSYAQSLVFPQGRV